MYQIEQMNRLELEREVIALRNRIVAYENYEMNGEIEYVGSAYSNRFHRPSCDWALEINPYNRITWPSHEAAVRDGRKPCQTCKA